MRGASPRLGSCVLGLLVAVSLVAAASASLAQTPSTTVYFTKTGAKYHAAGCSSLARSSIPMKLGDASLSYGPCSRCRPPVLSSASSAQGSQPATAVSAGGGRCQAITKKGTQCKRRAKAGSRYCWQHGAQ